MNKYCLSNLYDFSSLINEPLKHTNRIKYTCFDASENFFIFGATTGSLYLFHKKDCKFLHLIPNKLGAVSYVSISPEEKYVAFCTQKGVVSIYVINTSVSTPQVIGPNSGLGSINANNFVEITCLRWSLDEKQFYYGDNKGQVNMVALNSYMGRSILTVSVHPILFTDASVVQIDDYESLLVVSNNNKCIICNTEYEEYKQIGNRPRDGDYGACFLLSADESETPSRIYCSRPGSRIWEVDLEGNVIQTHQFKTSLACPPSKIQRYSTKQSSENLNNENENQEVLDFQPQHLQFSKLQPIFFEFLVSFNENALYIFDLKNSKVVLWCNQFERIADVRIVGDELIIFSQSGGLHSVRLQTIQSYAKDLIRREHFLDCSLLLKRNLKYFVDKVKEDYELSMLNVIKTYLFERNQYEMLNDLSVVFDSLSHIECGLSFESNSEDRKSSVSDNPSLDSAQSSVYVLENSFCDNLRNSKENNFKDALLTVTGKFGKNIIKYKFNIFSNEQQTLVKDLLPKALTLNERSIPFKDIVEKFENEEEIVCKKSTKKTFLSEKILTDEERTIYNLFLIFRSSQISNTNCLERYRELFDEYTSNEIITILQKLEKVMVENGDLEIEAKKNCYTMYFNYLNPEIIYEIDYSSREFIFEGFILCNKQNESIYCSNCQFPIRYVNTCKYHFLGETLLKYFWSRNEFDKCHELIRKVPSLNDIMCKFYLNEGKLDKVILVVMTFGDSRLLEEMGKYLDIHAWEICFTIFSSLQTGELTCSNCLNKNFIENFTSNHFFYTWNCFLNISLQFLSPNKCLQLVLKLANKIPNDAIDRQFFKTCLMKCAK